MKRILFAISLALCLPVLAGDFSVMAGHTWFGKADDGTYWNKNQQHNIELEKSAHALRYDTSKTNGWGFAAQYTDFGTAKLDAMASSNDAPDMGGYDPATGGCVGGTCSPLHNWVATSHAKSIAAIGTKTIGPWTAELGWHVFSIDTTVTVNGSCLTSGCGTSWGYSKTGMDSGPMAGASYAHGPWALHLQVWFLETKGKGSNLLPSINTGYTTTAMLRYKFW